MKIKLFGTKIELSFLFFAVVSIVIYTDKTGFAVPMLFAVSLHETAHLVVMWLLGCQPKEIILVPSQISIIREISFKRKTEIIISLAGPFINILLFIFCYHFQPEFAVINLLFGLFSLLPVKGLDGGEIVKIIIIRFLNEEAAELTLKIINIIIGAAGLFLGITLILRGTLNISVIIISIYFLLSVIVKF